MEKENFIEIMMSLFTCLHGDREYRFKQPVLLVCGEDDIAGNIKKSMKNLSKIDNNCNFCLIKNAGHNSNQDNPDYVNKNINIFLGKNI